MRLKRAMLVTGRSVSAGEPFRALVDQLGDAVGGVFNGVQAHNPVDRVVELIQEAKTVDADVFIGVGGGSPIDAAKLAALGVSEGVETTEDLSRLYVEFEYPSTVRIRPLSSAAAPDLRGAHDAVGR